MLDPLLINGSESIKNAMKTMDSNGYGFVFIVGKNNKLQGVVTDGDVRRMLRKGLNINDPVSRIMNTKPIKLVEGKNLAQKKKKLIAELATLEKKIKEPVLSLRIPVVTQSGILKKVVTLNAQTKQFSDLADKFENGTGKLKNILVVGGAGYLGSIVCRQLLKAGYRVRALDLLLFGEDSVRDLYSNPKFEMVYGDIRNIDTVHKALEDIDAVIHLASIVGDPASQERPEDTIETNYLATMSLAMACKYQQINKFIFASTCSVYGVSDEEIDETGELHPVSLYARSKIESEKGIVALADANFKPIILRMGTLYGLSHRMRFDLVVNTFAKAATINKKITIFGGEQWRPLVHVEDAARAYMACLSYTPESNESLVFNLGSAKQNYSIRQLGEIVKKVLPQTKVEIQATSLNPDARTYKVNFQKITKKLKFRPRRDIEQAVKEINEAIVSRKITNTFDSKYYNARQS